MYFLNNDEMNSVEQKIINVDIDKEMQESFMAYSMSVIMSRALPDVRDGLKPVHRRILYTLFENNLGPDKAYRKCADTVGSVLGRYHPHGDASVYDALVRLAQDFSMRYILVDGHGNFGSIDGDPPAAYRYTESRMSKMSVNMLTDIEKNTVDFVPNYDDRLKEPVVLPSRFPNLLVNGSTGIAVGMTTNIPPHNLKEVIDAINLLIDNPDATLDEIMQHIKGPDFPTGAKIMGLSGIRAAYTTGRGKITVRACTEIVEDKNGKSKIIVTELPYMVNKARLCESIANLVKDKKIDGITNIEDHSDRDGMHIEISVRRDASAQVVLNKLFSYTQLQTTFGAIMLAIVNGEPKILTLKEMLQHYIDFQVDVVTRRTQFDLQKAREREHILEGLKIAIDFIDEVIEILRSSKSVAEGKERLMKRFELDEIQAQAIVQMRLGQLTGLERSKIEDELVQLAKKIAEFEDLLANHDKLLGLVKSELAVIGDKFNDPRRTQIEMVSGEVDIEDLISNDECVLTLTNFGYLKRQKTDTYRTQRRGGRGVSGMTCREEDVATDMFVINNHDYVMLFTNLGKVYRIKGYNVPEGSRQSKGTNVANILPLVGDEQVTSMIRVEEYAEDKYLVMVTKNGIIKRTELSAYENIRKSGLIAVNLDEGDELAWVCITDGKDELLFATSKGKSLRIKESDVRVVGRGARGVRAIRLADGDYVVGMVKVSDDKEVLTVSTTGYGRVTSFDEYRLQNRGGKGTINYHIEKYGDVASIMSVDEEDDVILISDNGVIIRIPVNSIRKCSRTSKGVKVMRLDDNSQIVTVAVTPKSDEDESERDTSEVEVNSDVNAGDVVSDEN